MQNYYLSALALRTVTMPRDGALRTVTRLEAGVLSNESSWARKDSKPGSFASWFISAAVRTFSPKAPALTGTFFLALKYSPSAFATPDASSPPTTIAVCPFRWLSNSLTLSGSEANRSDEFFTTWNSAPLSASLLLNS